MIEIGRALSGFIRTDLSICKSIYLHVYYCSTNIPMPWPFLYFKYKSAFFLLLCLTYKLRPYTMDTKIEKFLAINGRYYCCQCWLPAVSKNPLVLTAFHTSFEPADHFEVTVWVPDLTASTHNHVKMAVKSFNMILMTVLLWMKVYWRLTWS
jgi:hypothetical protein